MPWGNTWYQPLLFYIVAAALTVAPLSEFAVRLPVAIVGGVITPILLYLVALRLFKRRGLALFSAVVLALSPPHLILSRQALDYVCPLPFMLGWFWFLARLHRHQTSQVAPCSAGVCLGLGFYSYIASWVMMPIYLALSAIVVLARRHGGCCGRCVGVDGGFVVPLLVLIPWLWTHPAMLRETFDRYQMSDQEQVSMIQEPGNAFRLDKVAATVSTYWSHFDPAFLFMIGGPSMTTSTGRVGVFLLPLALLLPLGVFALLRRPDPVRLSHGRSCSAWSPRRWPPRSRGSRSRSNASCSCCRSRRWLPPSASTGCGRRARAAARVAAMALVVGVPLQFAVFYRDLLHALQAALGLLLRSGGVCRRGGLPDGRRAGAADLPQHRARRCGREMAVLHHPGRPAGQDGAHALRRCTTG